MNIDCVVYVCKKYLYDCFVVYCICLVEFFVFMKVLILNFVNFIEFWGVFYLINFKNIEMGINGKEIF